MSLLGSFTGATQKKYANQAYENSTRELQQGFDQSKNYATDYYDKAQGFLQPYAQQGQQANDLYGRHIGLQGNDARRNALSEYADGDPFRQYNQDQTTRAMARRYNAMGALNSGRADYATSRALMDRGSQDHENYLSRLQGMQGQGLQIAGQQSGMASGLGQYFGNLRMGQANTQAGNEIQHANALSQAAGILPKNLLSLGGLAMQAFAPGGPAMGMTGPLAGMTGGYNAGSMSGLGGALAMGNYGNVGQSDVGMNGLPPLGKMFQ